MDRCTSVFSCKNKDKRISKRRILYLSYHQHPLTSGSQHVQDMAITSVLFNLRGPLLLVQPVFRERPASARTVTTWPMQQARRQRAACFVLPGSAASSAPRQTSTSVWSQDKADLYCMTRTLGATGINPISCSRWEGQGFLRSLPPLYVQSHHVSVDSAIGACTRCPPQQTTQGQGRTCPFSMTAIPSVQWATPAAAPCCIDREPLSIKRNVRLLDLAVL